MDERLTGHLNLDEASHVLRDQWRDGQPDLPAVAGMLSSNTDDTLLQLIAVDSEEAESRGYKVDVTRYLQVFPQLMARQAELVARLKPEVQTGSNTPDAAAAAIDMFSQASLAPTQLHKSNKPPSGTASASKRLVTSDGRPLPECIGNFRVEAYIGRGSFGMVLQGRDKRLDRKVAIKIKDHAAEAGLSEDFLHEARSICRLEHSNIVRLLQADETDEGIGYLVYEFVDGEMLSSRIERNDYTLNECVHWIASIADALDYAHRRAIVHRDVSPRNIMITREGTARLLDFGLSKRDERFYTDDSESILGTPHFMSPEQASGKPHWATAYSDQFSLGSVLYLALTQRLPFPGKSELDILERIQKATPAAPRSIRDEIPPKLEEVCLRALAKEPQQRYSTAADMSAALINALVVPAALPANRPALPATSLLVIGMVLALAGVVTSILGVRELLRPPATVATKSAPTIDEFDLKVTVDGPPQRSLLFDPIPELSLDQFLILTVSVETFDKETARLYLFNYEHGTAESGRWQPIKVDGPTTTIMGDRLREGPNIVLWVQSDSASNQEPLLVNAPFKLADKLPLKLKGRLGPKRTIYRFDNNTRFKEDKFQPDVVERAPITPAGTNETSEFLKDLGSKWNIGAFDLDKGQFGSAAYCGIALWVEGPTPNKGAEK